MPRSPSKIRYDQSHPTVSFRVKREDYDKMKKLLNQKGQSIADFFKEALGIQEESYQKAYDNGYNDAKKKCTVRHRCRVCKEWIEIASDKEKEEAREAMEFHKWGHNKCIDKQREQREELERKKAREQFLQYQTTASCDNHVTKVKAKGVVQSSRGKG